MFASMGFLCWKDNVSKNVQIIHSLLEKSASTVYQIASNVILCQIVQYVKMVSSYSRITA